MGSLTTRFALTMPDPADQVDVSQLNVDLQAIDNGLGYLPCTSSTRPSSPSAGQAIYETDTRRRYLWDTSGVAGVWVLISDMGAVLTAPVVATNIATLAAITEWSVPLAANSTYQIEIVAGYSAAAGADAQLGIVPPSGSTMLLVSFNLTSSASGASDLYSAQALTSSPAVLGGVGVGVNLAARISGSVITGSTAGNLALSWAQVTAQASNATLLAGSILTVQRI